MDIQKQIELIKSQKPVEKLERADLIKVFERSVFLFRKYIGPLNEATSLEKNIKRMMILCRLENDAEALSYVLAARAAAQLEGSARPGEHDDLIRSVGLDISENSAVALGDIAPKYVMVNPEGAHDNNFDLTFMGQKIIVAGGAIVGEFEAESFTEACAQIDRLNTRSGGKKYAEVNYREATSNDDLEIFDTVHDPWRATTIYNEKLKKHPTQIIEPSTLAATPYPRATYKPMLPVEAIERGAISDAQFECITYCLQAITQMLPGSPLGPRGPQMKGGFIIGDGTGVGKTNEFCGAIMDQWIRGKKRHIIVVERSKHVEHVKGAWSMIGGDPKNVLFQGDRGAGESLPSRDGIMVTTYALIRDDRRYNSLVEWANETNVMDGVLVFDEAHNMRNAVEDNFDEGSGKKNQSQQGMAGVELQAALPRAGVIYASATMATDVYNLGYAQRLGLWGENAPFQSETSFISELHSLDEAALEQICIDLKSAGRYCSRTLSFDGVEYDELEHRLTPKQKERFDQTVKSWRTYSKMVAAATQACTKKAVSSNRGFNDAIKVQRNQIETLLTNFSVETLIEDIHSEIAKGNSPVIQISMTGEARTKRIIGEKTDLTIEEYRENALENYIQNSFPVNAMKMTPKGLEEILDANGRPIPVPEAIAIRDEALRLSREVAIDMNALDRIYLEFGIDNVAEMTGRSVRMIPVMNRGEHVGWKAEERKAQSAIEDVKAFQDGRKRILIFSLGAGGTGLSYHASNECRNKDRRVHYILEIGRRAESAVQGIGRTHRSGQIQPPIVKIVKCDIPAHTIYTSKTLAKIQKMGALSRGHQHATTNAIFEQRIPLHTVYAERGWASLLGAVQRGEIEGVKEEQLYADLGLESKDMKNLQIVLGRLAVLTDGEQRYLVDELRNRTEEAISNAVRNGSYNQGLETIQSESIEILDRNEIENANGSRTSYYRLVKHDKIDRTPFSQAMMLLVASKRRKNIKGVFMRHKVNGKIALGISRDNGTIVDITTPAGSFTRRAEAIRNEPWRLVSDPEEAKRNWELEYENMDLEETSELHMLSGSLLYNWNKLPKTGIGLTRCKVKSGEIVVGRMISKYEIKSTLQSLGMRSNYAPAQIASMLGKVKNGAVLEMDNGWSIDLPQGDTDFRLNVPDGEQTGPIRKMLKDLGVNEVISPLGSEFTIESQLALEVIQKLAIGSDLSVTGVVRSNGSPNTAAMAAMINI